MPEKKKKEGRKKQVLSALFGRCLDRDEDMVFGSQELGEVAKDFKFKNQYDAVKIDRSKLLPEIMQKKDHYLIHIGDGRYKFVRGVKAGFHSFEDVPVGDKIPWKYRKSVLNETDDSESSILSMLNNQRILHDFLYDDINASPKMYNARRTKVTAAYTLGNESIEVEKLQIEMDMVCEYMGHVTVFEAKKGKPDDFAKYQLFHPYLYFKSLREKMAKREKEAERKKRANPQDTQKETSPFAQGQRIESVDFCFVLHRKGSNFVRLYLYEFTGDNPATIRLKRCAEYRLEKR